MRRTHLKYLQHESVADVSVLALEGGEVVVEDVLVAEDVDVDEDEVLPEDVEQDRAVIVYHNGVPIHPQSQYSPSIDLLAQPSLCLLAS